MEALVSPLLAPFEVKGAFKVSLILESTLFDQNLSAKTIDGSVLSALGGDAWEELEANSTIDAQVH